MGSLQFTLQRLHYLYNEIINKEMKKYLNIENFGRVLCKVWNILAHFVFAYFVTFVLFLDEYRESGVEGVVEANDLAFFVAGFVGLVFNDICLEAIKRPWKINK